MSGAAARRPATKQGRLRDLLQAAVRPEFRVAVYRPDPADPVLGGGPCGVGGCDGLLSARRMCVIHYGRWKAAGRPDVEVFVAAASPVARRSAARRSEAFDLRGLPGQVQLEVQFALQCRHDESGMRLSVGAVGRVVRLVSAVEARSLLALPLGDWLDLLARQGWRDNERSNAFMRFAHVRIDDLARGADATAEYARDTWDARRLGLGGNRRGGKVHLEGIGQLWLREVTKRWARFRLATGMAFGTVAADARAIARFSSFLADCHPAITGPAGLTRDAIESYLSWLSATELATPSRSSELVSLRGLLEDWRRHGWAPQPNRGARIYQDDLPRRPDALPRFIPEFVMGQLEKAENLSQLADPTTRHLVVVVMETGLRSGDACALPIDPIVDDSVGWPCLRFYNSKVRTEQMVPLSPKAADAIRSQQAHVRTRWPAGTRWLFPRERANLDGAKPFSYGTLHDRLDGWQEMIGLRDEAGRPVRVTLHRFRHTLGTRMINQGVPQHVVQQMLGHRSPQMTATYAHLHDSTVRESFDRFCQARVNISGELLGYDPDAPTAGAEWVKHNLARAHDSLPNGYCGRPPQQDCPHPNACLTCPDFQTTPEFLPVHRQQLDNTRILIATADANGQFRLAANHRQVGDSLGRIIPALEAIQAADHGRPS